MAYIQGGNAINEKYEVGPCDIMQHHLECPIVTYVPFKN